MIEIREHHDYPDAYVWPGHLPSDLECMEQYAVPFERDTLLVGQNPTRWRDGGWSPKYCHWLALQREARRRIKQSTEVGALYVEARAALRRC